VTEVIAVDAVSPDANAIAHAAACLRRGGLVAFPTETVYGLGVHALEPSAVRRLFAAKERPASDPLIVHVGSIDDASTLLESVTPDAVRLAVRFWPGPLTLVMPRSSRVPDEVTAGLGTVAIRAPAHPVARALLAEARIPIAAPSANLFSRPSPTLASHVVHDLDGRIDIVLDAGATPLGVESTVLDLTAHRPTVLRPGAVTLDMLRELLPLVHVSLGSHGANSVMRSPGLLEKHYSPRAPLTLYEGSAAPVFARLIGDLRAARAAGLTVGIVCAHEDRLRLAGVEEPDVIVADLGPVGDLGIVASRLYAALRQLDSEGVDVILARGFPASDGLGVAVRDRLRRAAAGRIVSAGGEPTPPRTASGE
jgi:L-threonylcarbamoyladenylate synthase